MLIEINALVLIQALLLIVALQVYFYLRTIKRIDAQKKRMVSFRSELQALLLCSRGVGEQLHDQQEQFRDIQDRQEALELNEGSQPVQYQQIMAMMGSDVNESRVMDQCDLTKGELELMQHLKKTPGLLDKSTQQPGSRAWN